MLDGTTGGEHGARTKDRRRHNNRHGQELRQEAGADEQHALRLRRSGLCPITPRRLRIVLEAISMQISGRVPGWDMDIPVGASLGRYLRAYRGNLTREEAARRSGLSEARWEQVETGSLSSDRGLGPLQARTVAAMCAAVGADVSRGLRLAGYDPDDVKYLLESPPGHMPVATSLSPRIAFHRTIADIAAAPPSETAKLIASVYRDVAAENRHLAERIANSPPDERTEYWAGYVAALRAIADEQLRIADLELPHEP